MMKATLLIKSGFLKKTTATLMGVQTHIYQAIHQLTVWHNNHCITPPSHISWSNVLKFQDLNTHVLYIIFLFCTLRAFMLLRALKQS